GRVRMLSGMPEPIAGAVALEAGELAAGHDLDRPDLRHRDRQEQAGPRVRDGGLAQRAHEPRYIARVLPFAADMPRHQINGWRTADPHVLRGAGGVEPPEIHSRPPPFRAAHR